MTLNYYPHTNSLPWREDSFWQEANLSSNIKYCLEYYYRDKD